MFKLYNKNTGEEHWFHDNEEAWKAAETKVDKIYYVRSNIMENGDIWMDFGSYEWFLVEVINGRN